MNRRSKSVHAKGAMREFMSSTRKKIRLESGLVLLLLALVALPLFNNWVMLTHTGQDSRSFDDSSVTPTGNRSQVLYENAIAKGFPRYAITSFVVSSKDTARVVELLRSVGAYNVTLIYRGVGLSHEPEEILKIWQSSREFGGIMIPEFSFMQTVPPASRAMTARDRFAMFKSVVGEYPRGIFAFQFDTYTLNYLRDSHAIEFAVGNVWDQVNLDFMSNRGAFSFPYYASRRNAMVPATVIDDTSALVIPPFVISLTDTHHYDSNHLIDLLTHWGDLEEFKYLSSSYPFFTPFFLELDWLLALKDNRMIQAFVEAYRWVFKNFQVVTPLFFSQIFARHFPKTPEYHVFFRSSNRAALPGTAGRLVEWLMNPEVRIARMNGQIVSALRYKVQACDKYLTSSKTIDYTGFRFGENPANMINLDLVFDVDALWQHEYGSRTLTRGPSVGFNGDLHDFHSSEDLTVPPADCLERPHSAVDEQGPLNSIEKQLACVESRFKCFEGGTVCIQAIRSV